jgi:molecular chaperone GrpE
LDETIREKLLSRFVAYLYGLDHDESGEAPAGTAEEVPEEADLFSVFVELAGLRNEVRTQSRIVKEALDRFRSVFDTLQASHATLEQELKRARADAHDRERTLLKPLLIEIIDVRDRLAAGLKPAVAAPPRRWYERFPNPKATRAAAEAWREGVRMTLRRVDRLLADQRIAAIETVGRPFDPRHAAAVATVEDAAAADGIVVEEVRPGFLWQGELLRPAEVIVARRDVRNGDNA